MTTAVIVGVLLLLALGLVASQLFRLKDWLDRQPTVEPTMPPRHEAEEERDNGVEPTNPPDEPDELNEADPHAT